MVAKHIGVTCRIVYQVRGERGFVCALVKIRAEIITVAETPYGRNRVLPQYAILRGSDGKDRAVPVQNIRSVEPANRHERARLRNFEYEDMMREIFSQEERVQ